MKRTLLLLFSLLLISNAALADHIGIYSDPSGAECRLTAGVTTAWVIHKYNATGATASRFRIDSSSLVGTIFVFNSTYVTIGNWNTDVSIAYGGCLSGPIVLGSFLMNATGGRLYVREAQGQSCIVYTDCNFSEYCATGGNACVACQSSCECQICAPTEQSTWGSVKALYR
jgi:hypothetical protein